MFERRKVHEGVGTAANRLTYRKGLLGDLLITLETGDRRIQLGNVPIWEDQEQVMGYIDELSRRQARPAPPEGRTADLAWK